MCYKLPFQISLRSFLVIPFFLNISSFRVLSARKEEEKKPGLAGNNGGGGFCILMTVCDAPVLLV